MSVDPPSRRQAHIVIPNWMDRGVLRTNQIWPVLVKILTIGSDLRKSEFPFQIYILRVHLASVIALQSVRK